MITSKPSNIVFNINLFLFLDRSFNVKTENMHHKNTKKETSGFLKIMHQLLMEISAATRQ